MASTARPTFDRSRDRPDAKAMGAFYTRDFRGAVGGPGTRPRVASAE